MDTSNKRDISEFCEHLNEVQQHFSKFDSCERTIALYYLLVGLPFSSARFLQRALEESICRVNTAECQMLERNANDPIFISTFLSENPEVALSKMLMHIPLLRPGNKEALKGYCTIIRHILSEIITPPSFKIYNECVEILSYVFVHPAFSREDKKSFKYTLHNVLQSRPIRHFSQSSLSESSDESYSPIPDANTFLQNGSMDLNRLQHRSNSLIPVQITTENIHYKNRISKDNLAPSILKPRSFSLSTDKCLPVRTSSIQTSSSETRLQDLHNSSPMMKDIVNWLKSLRLHKYSWVFNKLTYEQMLNLTEEDLESIGITKGARHKLLLNISKLKERSKMLTQMEVEVMNGGDLLTALKKLKGVLQSPLQITAAENLPSQFIKVMGKVCTQLLMLRQPQDECIQLFVSLCDNAEILETFTEEQRKRLVLWRGQLIYGNQFQSSVHSSRHQSSTNQRHHHAPSQLHHSPTISSFQPGCAHKSSSYPNMQGNQRISLHRHSLGSATLQKQLHQLGNQFTATQDESFLKNDLLHTFTTFKNSDFHTNFHEPEVLQMHSSQGIRNSDIESSLESLCLQMMEHALGP